MRQAGGLEVPEDWLAAPLAAIQRFEKRDVRVRQVV
jgi:hypothetical protein